MDWYLRYWPYLAAYHLFGLFWCAPSLGAVPPSWQVGKLAVCHNA